MLFMMRAIWFLNALPCSLCGIVTLLPWWVESDSRWVENGGSSGPVGHRCLTTRAGLGGTC